MKSNMHSYPSVYNLGHRQIQGIFSGPVTVEEKVDGSQISFSRQGSEVFIRSKSAEILPDAPEKMFSKAVDSIQAIAHRLEDGWVYRGEYLQKPKHNALAYDRVPDGNIVVFDIQMHGEENYLDYAGKEYESQRIGLQCVPLLYQGEVSDVEMLKEMLDTMSFLGGQKIEGVVVKNYGLFTDEKKIAIGKHVSERFREIASGEWRKANPTRGDILDELVITYRTPARWEKAIQHLRDAGKLEGDPRDIGLLMKEVPEDILKECEDDIKDALFKHFWPKVRRGVTSGLPEWYKNILLEQAFEDKA